MSELEAGELLIKGIHGLEITKDYVLKVYANEENWGKFYDESGAHWFWKGPVICPFELAQWVRK